MKRLLTLSLFFLLVISLRAQRYGIIPQELCWSTGSVDSSVTRYFLVSTRSSTVTPLTYLNASGQKVDVSGGGTFSQGHCGCCGGNSSSTVSTSTPARSGLTNDGDTLKLGGVAEENTSLSGMNQYGLDVTNWKYLSFSASDSFKIITPELVNAAAKLGGLLQLNSLTGRVEFTPYAFPLTTGIDGQFQQLNGTTGELEWQSPYITAIETDTSFRFSVNGSSVSSVSKYRYQVSDTSLLRTVLFPRNTLVQVQETGGFYQVKPTNDIGAAALNTYFLKQNVNGDYLELQKEQGRYNIKHLGANSSSFNLQPILTTASSISSSSNEIDLYYPNGEYLVQGSGVVIIDQYVNHYFDGGYINLDATSTSYEMVFDGEVVYSAPWIDVNDSDSNYARVSFRHSSFDQKVFDAAGMYRWYLGSQTEANRKRNDIMYTSIFSNIENYVKNGGQVKMPSVNIELTPYKAPNSGVDYYHSINEGIRFFSEGKGRITIYEVEANKSDQDDAYWIQRGPGVDFEQENVDVFLVGQGYDTYTPTYSTSAASNQITLGAAILDAAKDWVDKYIHLSGGTLGDTAFLITSRISNTVLQVDQNIDIADTGNAWLTDSYEDGNLSYIKSIGDVNGGRPTYSVDWGKGHNFITKTSGSWSASQLGVDYIIELTGPDDMDSTDVEKYLQARVLQINADTAWIDNTIPVTWTHSTGTDPLAEVVSTSTTKFINCTINGPFRRIMNNGTNNWAEHSIVENCKISGVSAVFVNQARSPYTQADFLYNDIRGMNSNINGTGQVDECCTNSTIIYGNPFNSVRAIGNRLHNVMVHGFYGNRGSEDFMEGFFDVVKYKRNTLSKVVFEDNIQTGYGNYGVDVSTVGDAIIKGNTLQNGFQIEAGGNIYVENNTITTYGDSYSRNLPAIHLKPKTREGQIFMDNNQVFQRNSGVGLRITRSVDGGSATDQISNFTIISDSLATLPDAGNFIGEIQPYIVIKSPNKVQFDKLKIEGRDATDPYTHVFYIDSVQQISLLNSEIDLADATGEYLFYNLDASYDFILQNSTYNTSLDGDIAAGSVNVIDEVFVDKGTIAGQIPRWSISSGRYEPSSLNQGIANTVAGPGTSLVITHNLGQAPTYISITPGGDIGDWFVNTINSTTMTLNYTSTATTTASSVNIYWQVE